MGKCPDCGAWDSLESYRPPTADDSKHSSIAGSWTQPADGPIPDAASAPSALPLPEIETSDVERLPTGIGELDRVLGGGFVPASVVLLGGDPGIGKSTLLLQAAGSLAQTGANVLYVTSEESAFQTRLRAQRLFDSADRKALEKLSNLYVLADTNLARMVEQARAVRPAVMVVDSVQMIYKADLDAAPGSVTQLRRCCMELVYLAKISGISIVLVGHVTKQGNLAGPKLLEHLVDVVLGFDGDRHHAHRVVRSMKNRFGTTLEVGLFEMAGDGLREITDPAGMIDIKEDARPGTVICPVMHGSRCLPVEIQALVAPGILGMAKRKTSGLDGNRLAMLIAVLEQHGGLRLADQDVFTSVIGGLKVVEPAADLAICLAIAGAHGRRSHPTGTVVIGEVGLDGRLRCPPQMQQRLAEASRRGLRAIVPSSYPEKGANEGVVRVADVQRAIQLLS